MSTWTLRVILKAPNSTLVPAVLHGFFERKSCTWKQQLVSAPALLGGSGDLVTNPKGPKDPIIGHSVLG